MLRSGSPAARYVGRVQGLIAWSGFVGAWLLLAGPIYQAAIELGSEAWERDAVARASSRVAPPDHVSAWWWLLPPVGYVLQRRARRRYRQAVMSLFTAEQMQQFVRFSNKATGWHFVGAGAFFIALKETWELAEHYEWPGAFFWVLVPVMFIVCALNTAVRIRRNQEYLGGSAPEAG